MSQSLLGTIGPESRQDHSVSWIREGTDVFESLACALSVDEVGQPSLLPGWRRAEVIAHVARNADALVNLTRWAKTGVRTPMYPVAGDREIAIERDGRRPAEEIISDLLNADGRLAAVIAEMRPADWNAAVVTAQGRDIPAKEILWMRTREVWLHAVDLDVGRAIEDLPLDLVVAFLTEASERFGTREDYPSLLLVADGVKHPFSLGASDDDRVELTASAQVLFGWISGRIDLPDVDVTLPPWL